MYKPQYSWRLHFGQYLIMIFLQFYLFFLLFKVQLILYNTSHQSSYHYSTNIFLYFSLIECLHNCLDVGPFGMEAGKIKDLTTDSAFHDKKMVP